MTPANHNNYTAKIRKLKNGRVTLQIINHQNNNVINRECRSEGEAVKLLQLSGKRWVQVEEIKVLRVKEC